MGDLYINFEMLYDQMQVLAKFIVIHLGAWESRSRSLLKFKQLYSDAVGWTCKSTSICVIEIKYSLRWLDMVCRRRLTEVINVIIKYLSKVLNAGPFNLFYR